MDIDMATELNRVYVKTENYQHQSPEKSLTKNGISTPTVEYRETGSVSEDYCSSPDSGIEVCDAIHILLPLVKERYKFGICANIEPSELDILTDRYHEPVQCLSNIVDRWNRTRFDQSWDDLANVVEKMQNYPQVVRSLKEMAGKVKVRGQLNSSSESISLPETWKKVASNSQEQLQSNGADSNSKRDDKRSSRGMLQFKCAGGGDCTIRNHFEGKTCDKHMDRYPYLEVRGEPYETDIEIYLEDQTENMRDSFANLMQDTRQQLQELVRTTTPYSEVQGYVKLLVAGKAGYDAIKNAKDLSELQDALIETCCSWFNHGIVTKLRRKFLLKSPSERDHMMEAYSEDFIAYCKRRCFESPAALHPDIDISADSAGSQALVFKVEQDFHTSTLTDILQTKKAVAKILGCPPHAINVCMVKQGCIEVVCQLLPIAEVEGISDEQVCQLKQHSIISFKVDGVELMPVHHYQIMPRAMKEKNGTLTMETIMELTHSPTNHNRKVFTFTFPSKLEHQATASSRTEDSGSIDPSARDKVIAKIVDTERKYIHHLQALLNGYFPAVAEVTTPRDLRLLFPAQLEPMMERHEELLSQLEGQMKAAHTSSSAIVGDIFACLFNLEFLNMYSAYMRDFKAAVKMLTKCKQNSPRFSDQLSMCQNSFLCEGLSLSSYLTAPVHRLPRYELLLKELLKHTPEGHQDHSKLAEATDMLHKGLIRLNHSIKLCLLASSVQQVHTQRSAKRLSSQRLGNAARNEEEESGSNSVKESEYPRQNCYTGEEGYSSSSSRRSSNQSVTISKPASPYCSHLSRNVSTRSSSFREDSRGAWIRSRLSIHSNSSCTSGYGSMSTNPSHLDLAMTPPAERNARLSFTSSSVPSTMRRSTLLTTSFKKERSKTLQDKGMYSAGSGAHIERHMSWTNSKLTKKGYISSTTYLGGEPCYHGPPLHWSEESIEAVMRWDEDTFENLVEGRSAVSCSDLLLAVSCCNERPKDLKLAHHPLENCPSTSEHNLRRSGSFSVVHEMTRTLSQLSLYSSSSSSGVNSVINSQLDLTDEPIANEMTPSANRLSTSMPALTHASTSNTNSV